jgi:hypothetical protein
LNDAASPSPGPQAAPVGGEAGLALGAGVARD